MSHKELVSYTPEAVTPEIVSPHEAQLGMAATPVGEVVLPAPFEAPTVTAENTIVVPEAVGASVNQAAKSEPSIFDSQRTFDRRAFLGGAFKTAFGFGATAVLSSFPDTSEAAADETRATNHGAQVPETTSQTDNSHVNAAREASGIREKALEPGSNFKLDSMVGTSDGNVTAGLVVDNDGKQHLVVGDKDLVFKDLGEFNVPIADVAINDKKPDRIAVAGSIGRGRDVGYIKIHYGDKVIELDGSKEEVIKMGGISGAKRGIQWIDENTLVTVGSSGSNVDLNPYVTEIKFDENGNYTIKNTKVEGMEGTITFTSLSAFSPIPERKGHAMAWATTVPTSGVAQVTRTPDGYSATQVLLETCEGLVTNDDKTGLSFRNQVPGRGQNDPGRIFGTISEMVGGAKTGEFQLPQNIFGMDFAGVAISGGAKILGENAYVFGINVGISENRNVPRLVRMDVTPDGSKNFRVLPVNGQKWPENAYIGAVKVHKDTNNKLVIDSCFGAISDGSRGRFIRTVDGVVQQVGNIGPRQTRPIEYRHRVFAPMQGKNAIPSRIAPK